MSAITVMEEPRGGVRCGGVDNMAKYVVIHGPSVQLFLTLY